MRNSHWEVAIVILNMVIRESLTKMTYEQTHKRDVDEPHGCLKYTPQTERIVGAKALEQEKAKHLYGSY